MDPINDSDYQALDVVPSAPPEELLCIKCHKSNAKLMRFQCRCDLPVHLECARILTQTGFVCPICFSETYNLESRSLLGHMPRRSALVHFIAVVIIVVFLCIMIYVLYNLSEKQKEP